MAHHQSRRGSAQFRAERKKRRIIWAAVITSNLIVVILSLHDLGRDCLAVVGSAIIHDWIATYL